MPNEDSVVIEEAKEEYSEQFSSKISRQDLLEEFRLQNLYCDFVIKAGNKIWNCHQNVLAATSPYFWTMLASAFLESSTGEVEFPEYMSDSLDIVLKYMYTGSIKISVSNVVAVHRVGSYLVINDLVDICIDFINRNFDLISKTEEFLKLEWVVLESIIESEQQQADEQFILEAVMKWVKHDPENRSKVLAKLMEHVRFDLISPTYLCQNIAQDDLMTSSTECKDLIIKVLANRLIQYENKGITLRKSRHSVMGDVYVIGGQRDGTRTHNSVLKYNSQIGEWCRIEYMDKPLKSFGATVVGNKIYTVGGCNSIACSTVEVQMFDTDLKKWSKVSQLIARRAALGVCSLSNKIYACGGIDHNKDPINSVEIWHLGVGSWKTTTPMNLRRAYVKVVCMEGSIWAIGGQSNVYTILSSVEQYDPREGRWSHQISMLTAKANHDAVVLDNKIYVCGGDSFEEYDPRNKQWRLLSPMMHRRLYTSLVVNGGKIWAIGGGSETVEIYDRCKNEWTWGTPLPWILDSHCAVVLPHTI